ncbi:hypothetical protein HDV57DRAFT_481512 [Trichoderma longibrachiatum]
MLALQVLCWFHLIRLPLANLQAHMKSSKRKQTLVSGHSTWCPEVALPNVIGEQVIRIPWKRRMLAREATAGA